MACEGDRSVVVTDLNERIPGFALMPAEAVTRIAAPDAGTLTLAEGGSGGDGTVSYEWVPLGSWRAAQE